MLKPSSALLQSRSPARLSSGVAVMCMISGSHLLILWVITTSILMSVYVINHVTAWSRPCENVAIVFGGNTSMMSTPAVPCSLISLLWHNIITCNVCSVECHALAHISNNSKQLHRASPGVPCQPSLLDQHFTACFAVQQTRLCTSSPVSRPGTHPDAGMYNHNNCPDTCCQHQTGDVGSFLLHDWSPQG